MTRPNCDYQVVALTAGLTSNSTEWLDRVTSSNETIVVAHNWPVNETLPAMASKIITINGEYSVGPALNLALRATWRDWIVFLHDDLDYDDDALPERLVEFAKSGHHDIVVPSIRGSSPSKHQLETGLSGWSHTGEYLSDSCFAMKREALLDLGGFGLVRTSFALASVQWKIFKRDRKKAVIWHDAIASHVGSSTWDQVMNSSDRYKILAQDLRSISKELVIRFDDGLRLAEPTVCGQGGGETLVSEIAKSVWSVGEWRTTTSRENLVSRAVNLSDTYRLKLPSGENVRRIQLGDCYSSITEDMTINLIVVPPLGLGDVVFTLKGISSIRNQFPNLKFHTFTNIASWRDLMSRCSAVDSSTCCDRSSMPINSVFVHRFGYVYEGITKRICAYFGLEYDGSSAKFDFVDDDLAEAERILVDKGFDLKSPILGVQLHGNWRTKYWSRTKEFELQAEQRGWQILSLGHAPRRQDVRSGQQLLGHVATPTLAVILGMCAAVVGYDSGIIHLASSIGTPSVSFWGPQDPTFFLFDSKPKQTIAIRKRIPHLHCGFEHCRNNGRVGNHCPLRPGEVGGECIDEISTNDVWRQLVKVLT